MKVELFAPCYIDAFFLKVGIAVYHLMVYTWGALTGFVALGLVLWWRGRPLQRRLLTAYVVAVIGPFVANEAGWVATERPESLFSVSMMGRRDLKCPKPLANFSSLRRAIHEENRK